MDPIRYRKVKQIEGDDRYEVEGSLLNRQEFEDYGRNLAEYGGSFREMGSNIDDDLSDLKKQYEDQLMGKYGDDINEDQIIAIDNEAKALAEKRLGINQPVQNAAPKGKRKAGQAMAPLLGKPVKIDNHTLTSLLLPWEQLTRQANSDDHIGYSEAEWYNRSDETKRELQRMRKAGARDPDLDGYLQDRGFGSSSSRDYIIRDLNRSRLLANVAVGSAHNAADEDLAMAVLEASGFSPVRSATDLDQQATDIEAHTNRGKKLMVDAQSRVSPRGGLNLSVLQRAPGFVDQFNQGNHSLIQTLNSYMQQANGRPMADKFMQYEKSPLINIQNDDDAKRIKDLLISSSRPGRGRSQYTSKQRSAPYNRERPEDWNLIDLGEMRNDLLNKNARQLDEIGIELREFDKSKSKLFVPESVLTDRYVNKNGLVLEPSIVNRLSRRR